MTDRQKFYDELAPFHHELYRSWDAFMVWQMERLEPHLQLRHPSLRILDASCSIGTLMIPLAKMGHQVTGIDISPRAIARANREMEQTGLGGWQCQVGDFLEHDPALEKFDRIVLLDNALAHASSDSDAKSALMNIRGLLNPGGSALFGLRDYEQGLLDKPLGTKPAFYRFDDSLRIVHQVWDWLDERRYIFHLYITRISDDLTSVSHFKSIYRASRAAEMAAAMAEAGFSSVEVIPPSDTGYHQYLYLAHA